MSFDFGIARSDGPRKMVIKLYGHGIFTFQGILDKGCPDIPEWSFQIVEASSITEDGSKGTMAFNGSIGPSSINLQVGGGLGLSGKLQEDSIGGCFACSGTGDWVGKRTSSCSTVSSV